MSENLSMRYEARERIETIPAGSYSAYAYFKKKPGLQDEHDGFTEVELGTDGNLTVKADTDAEKVREKLVSDICALGLHNFGMNILHTDYPDGHPVYVRLLQNGASQYGFTQLVDARGFPVNEEREGRVSTEFQIIDEEDYLPSSQ